MTDVPAQEVRLGANSPFHSLIFSLAFTIVLYFVFCLSVCPTYAVSSRVTGKAWSLPIGMVLSFKEDAQLSWQ